MLTETEAHKLLNALCVEPGFRDVVARAFREAAGADPYDARR